LESTFGCGYELNESIITRSVQAYVLQISAC
jgi:hypothetical protein